MYHAYFTNTLEDIVRGGLSFCFVVCMTVYGILVTSLSDHLTMAVKTSPISCRLVYEEQYGMDMSWVFQLLPRPGLADVF